MTLLCRGRSIGKAAISSVANRVGNSAPEGPAQPHHLVCQELGVEDVVVDCGPWTLKPSTSRIE